VILTEWEGRVSGGFVYMLLLQSKVFTFAHDRDVPTFTTLPTLCWVPASGYNMI
jgi:hypothetical protein